MIVEQAKRPARANGVSVKVCKHLLTTRETNIEKEHDGNGLISQFRLLIEGSEDRGAAVLPIINDEFRVHRNLECPETVLTGGLRERLENDLRVYRGCDGGEDIVFGVVDDVVG